jgi:hypothetical protein
VVVGLVVVDLVAAREAVKEVAGWVGGVEAAKAEVVKVAEMVVG